MTSDPADLQSMTARERLFAMGLLDEYEKAQEQGNVVRVRELLESVGVDQSSIDLIERRVLSLREGL